MGEEHQQIYKVFFGQSLTARTDNNPLSTEYSQKRSLTQQCRDSLWQSLIAKVMCSHWSSSRRDDSPQYEAPTTQNLFFNITYGKPLSCSSITSSLLSHRTQRGTFRISCKLFFFASSRHGLHRRHQHHCTHSHPLTGRTRRQCSNVATPLLTTKCICKRNVGGKDFYSL